MSFYLRIFSGFCFWRGLRRAGVAGLFIFAALAMSGTMVMAEAPKPIAGKINFAGLAITPLPPGQYRVANNVNVRAEPSSNGKRISSLKKGERITGVGSVIDAEGKKWLAVRKDGKDFGFISFNSAEPDTSLKDEADQGADPEPGTEAAVDLEAEAEGAAMGADLEGEADASADNESDAGADLEAGPETDLAPMDPEDKVDPALEAAAKSNNGASPFAGIAMTPVSDPYNVIINISVRDKPAAKGKKLGSLKNGDRVKAVGVAMDETGKKWLAVKKEGRELGFIPSDAAEVIILVKADFSISLKPESKTYMVNNDDIIRAKPRNDAEKIFSLKKGARVESMGKTDDGAWLSVKQGDEKLGYLPASSLSPLIDGSLDNDLMGKIPAFDGRACEYVISFDGKNMSETEDVQTFDYDVIYECAREGRKFKFIAFMFITEAPLDPEHNNVFQINVDLLDIGERYDEVLSVVFMYDKKNGVVEFDSVSQDSLAGPPQGKKRKVAGIKEALLAASEIAPKSWKQDVWDVLNSTERTHQEPGKDRQRQ